LLPVTGQEDTSDGRTQTRHKGRGTNRQAKIDRPTQNCRSK